ncbi:MAG: alanyl-tRNA editing protein [SAR202 cluster bacterium]|nr:alanyl-tRNA editing protein [SAR202 cluster bacterium]
MTQPLFQAESYLKEFEATVITVMDEGVVLDQTAFYTGGGGQPTDSGILISSGQEYQVSGIKRVDGQMVHLIEGVLPSQGSTVTGLIDWDRRYLLMRTHTAAHILCGVVWRDYGAQVTGGNMTPGEARMDFEFENLTAELAAEIEAKINAEVAAERDIVVSNLTREEAEQVPDLVRTKINLLPPNIQEIRTIDIQGLDMQADGGTHVANTREVGAVKMIGHESKGRINKRLRIALEE